MLDNKRKISTLIESQLPGFIADEYENFGKFLTAYYEQLELQGQPLDIINNLDSYLDISTYSNEILKESDILAANISDSDTTITLINGSSFPEKLGYIRIGDEICFYKSRNGNVLENVTRGVSGNVKIGDLYDKTEFVSTNAVAHERNAIVYNVSNLFLYALVKSFETQYLAGFPEKYLLEAADKRTLIKNIGDFYKAKGSEKSINFIFNTILTKSGEKDFYSTYNPKDFTIKASTSQWIRVYALRVKSFIGNPLDLVGKRIEQVNGSKKVFATVDNVVFINKLGNESIFELILAEESVTGLFDVASRTALVQDLGSADGADDLLIVHSTQGWSGQQGRVYVNNELITFKKRSATTFTIQQRSSAIGYSKGTPVYSDTYIKSENIQCIVLGVVSQSSVSEGSPYSSPGDTVEVISASFGDEKDPKRSLWRGANFEGNFYQNNLTWGKEHGLVQALYENDDYYYICSDAPIRLSELNNPSNGFTQAELNAYNPRQNHLKLIRKTPITTTEVYSSGERDVALSMFGVPMMSAKDTQYIENGELVEITITNRGKNYKNPPFVLVNNRPNIATAVMSGEVVSGIRIDVPGSYKKNPEITITSGRNATAKATVTDGKVTQIEVIQPGEYYSTPPTVRIIDGAGRGRFAEYTAEIDTNGRISGFTVVSEGNFYSQDNIQIEIVPVGENAAATAQIRKWYFDRYKKVANEIAAGTRGYFNTYAIDNFVLGGRLVLEQNIDPTYGLGPVHVPYRETNPSSYNGQHGRIIGYAYDGNPVYGAGGYFDPLDSTSPIVLMQSGYKLKTTRINGPSTSSYPLGTFVEDYYYEYTDEYRENILDENNGRWCVTPEYPNGTYAYFLTTDTSGFTVYPYIVGPTFYSNPVASNYTANIKQSDLPKDVKRLTTFVYGGGKNIPDAVLPFTKNGERSEAVIDSVVSGTISDCVVENTPETFSVGGYVAIDNTGTSGTGATAVVGSVKGKPVTAIESKDKRAVKIQLTTSAYLFSGDTLTQDNTNANGTILGDVVNGNEVILTDVSGDFNNNDLYTSSTQVVSLLLSQDSSYTKGATISLTDGDGAPLAQGEVLDATIRQNVVRLKVTSGSFFITEWESELVVENGQYIAYDGNVYTVSTTSLDTVALGTVAPSHRFGTVANGQVSLVFVARNVYLQSNELIDTVATTIITTTSLSSGLVPFTINENIAVVRTQDDHGLSIGDFVNVDINPDDATTNTEYIVRRRILQECTLQPQSFKTLLKNSGIGRLDILNSGNDYLENTYSGIELIFLDPEEARPGVGLGGDPGNATASVVVNANGQVESVTIENPGYGYAKGDFLTIPSASLGRNTGSLIPVVILQVDHSGFARESTKLNLGEVKELSNGDLLKINNEIVKITSIDDVQKQVVVERAQEGTIAVDHYFNQDVEIYNPNYEFFQGQLLGTDAINDPVVLSYDESTKKLTVAYNYFSTLSSINQITITSAISDSSSPSKRVLISSIESPVSKLQFAESSQATSDYNFVTTPILDLQNNYKYTFNFAHPSMNGFYFDVSPSKNQNLITLEKGSDIPRSIFLKFGYGPYSLTNDYDTKEDLRYLNYFYYSNDNSNNPTSSGEGYLRIISDPLQGQKQIDYVSNNSFVYLLDSQPQYDGSGDMTYTTTSLGAVGEVSSVNVTNFGSGYLNLPSITGIIPTAGNESTVRPIFDRNKNTITRVDILTNGKEYRSPKVVVTSGGGTGAQFQVLTNNRKVVRVIVLDGGSGYTTEPTLRVVESDISAYFTTDDIGVPRNVRTTNPGYGFHKDYTLLPYYRSNYVLKVSGSPIFYEGELVYQVVDSPSPYVTPSAYATVVEWIPGPNLLKIKNQVGIFNSVDKIYGATTKNNKYDVVDIFYTDFTPSIKNYYDNIGSYVSDTGRLNVGTQKLTDSYFYQDYSYVVKSRRSINEYRDLLKNTTHPAGFKLFGEMMIDSEGQNRIPENAGSHKTIKIITLYDENSNLITTSVVKERAAQSISNVSVLPTIEERGIGSIQVDDFNLTETVSNTIRLNQNFNGRLKDKTGQKTGRKSFDLIDAESGLPFTPYNDVQLIVTLDGVIQEPGISYTIENSTITFTEPPLGPLDDIKTFEDGSKILEWTSGLSVSAGDFVWHTNGIVYLALNSGVLGSTAPTHTTQSVQNGTVNLEYASLTRVPGQQFYCRAFKFKDDSLNSRYLKKFRNIFQRNGRWLDAANQIERNKTFIQEETIGYIKTRYPLLQWNTLEQKCYRDIGYIVDGYAKDLRFGGNSYTINNGKLYYDGTLLDHIDNQLPETLEAFEYAARLCKLAMRNWDYVYSEVTYFQGSDIMVVDDTSNVAIGMYVSAGNSYPEGTYIADIISDTELRLSSVASGAAGSQLISTDTDITQDTTTTTNTVGVFATLRVLNPYFYRVLQGGSNQATFYWSGVNTGTYYDAANLILANIENIKKEASFSITDGFQLFQYPDQPLEASVFKDARRLLYKNKDFIADYVLEGIDALFPGYTYGQLITGRQDFRDSVIVILDALATDLGRDSNENMVNVATGYFDATGQLVGISGGVTETIFGFQRLIDICQAVITNQGAPGGALSGFTTLTGRSAYYDLGIVSDPISGDNTSATNCADVRSAIDTLVNILISPINDFDQGNPINIASPTTGNTTWYKQEDKCKRDIGYLVKDVAYHLKFGGNRKIVEFGKFYYEGTNKVAFVNNELQETVYAFNKARDLMILAMRNDISGETIITPVIDPLVAPDQNSPECAAVESTIDTFAQIVEDTLTVGKDLYVITPENENYSGFYSTNTKSYSNYNLIDDPQLVASECDDVSSAIQLLYEALDTTLTVGKDAAPLSGADYFDGVTKEFELYFEDGTPADLDPNERLLVTLSGVLQTSKHAPNLPLGDSYYIDRSSVPNKIVFSSPPIWDQNDNVKEVQEPLAVEKFAARTIGSYERLGIDVDAITGKTGGPFIMKSLRDGKVKSIENPKYSIVFVDGVLQRNDSYSISGPAITFSEPLKKSDTGQYAKVDILLYYGKDTDQTVTIFDHEKNTYYHRIEIDIQGTNTFTTFENWDKGYADITVYQLDSNGVENVLGVIRSVQSTNANTWKIVLSSGETPKFDPSLPLLFQPNTTLGSSSFLSISGTFTFNYTLDTDGDRRMQKDISKWMYDSGLVDKSWEVKNRLIGNILPGDTIKIDGEDDFRTVVNIPSFVKSRNHLPGSQAWNQYYGKINVTNYDGVRRGEGLSVTCEIDTNTGKVTKLNWDDNSLELYFGQNLLENPTAYQYYWTPVLNFVSVDGTGGGAEAQVIVSKGQIVDVTLLNPGSGYTKPPLIKVSRGFARIKNNRKIDSFTTIGFENKVDQGMSEFTTSYITVVPPKLIPGVTTTVDVRPAIGFDTNADPIRKITNIIIPDPEEIEVGLDDTFTNRPQEHVVNIAVQDLTVASSSTVTTKFATFTEIPEITAVSEISKKVEIYETTATGLVDTIVEDYNLEYDSGILGNRASRLETTKFVGGGVIVNGITFEEFDRWFPNMTLEDWSNPIYDGTVKTKDAIWNYGYSTETQYMTYVDTTAIPGEGDPGYIATNAVVYVGSTASFPASGTVIVGREKITYTAKLSDRFTGVTRGAEGTKAEAHPLLELVRTIDP